jgi:hypothetical protein
LLESTFGGRRSGGQTTTTTTIEKPKATGRPSDRLWPLSAGRRRRQTKQNAIVMQIIVAQRPARIVARACISALDDIDTNRQGAHSEQLHEITVATSSH